MWLMLNDSFLSFVSKDCKPSELLVRARRPGDIEKVFPKAKVTEYDKSDYQFRAVVTRESVEQMLIGEVKRIVYNNFKNSVRDHDLHNAYNSVWGTMAKLQPKPPYSGFRGKSLLGDLFHDDFGIADLDKRAPARGKKKQPKKLMRGQ
jgi:hypothetical protein